MLTSQDASFHKTRDKAQAVGRVISRDPDIADLGMRRFRRRQPGQPLRHLKPKNGGARPSADAIIDRLAGQARRAGRGRNLPAGGRRTSMSAAAPGRRSTSTRSRIPTSTNCTPGRPGCSRRCNSCRSCATSTPTSRSTAARSICTIDRDAAARFGISPASIDSAIYDADRPGRGRPVFHAAEQLPRRARGAAALQGSPDMSSTRSTCSRRSPASGAALAIREGRPDHRQLR